MNPTTGNLHMAGQDLLERFAHALARIVHEERPEVRGRTVTVAELYQDIAPYRRLRDLAGFELHADYEHALIRFLAGEGGYAQLDPENAADELGIEAESSDPDLSLYRKFAACDVRLALGEPLPPRSAVEVAPAAPAETERAGIEETLRALRAEPPEESELATVTPPAAAVVPRASRAAANANACGFCGHALPSDRDVRFCPYCGADQAMPACRACGEALEDGWRFCVACGSPADS